MLCCSGLGCGAVCLSAWLLPRRAAPCSLRPPPGPARACLDLDCTVNPPRGPRSPRLALALSSALRLRPRLRPRFPSRVATRSRPTLPSRSPCRCRASDDTAASAADALPLPPLGTPPQPNLCNVNDSILEHRLNAAPYGAELSCAAPSCAAHCAPSESPRDACAAAGAMQREVAAPSFEKTNGGGHWTSRRQCLRLALRCHLSVAVSRCFLSTSSFFSCWATGRRRASRRCPLLLRRSGVCMLPLGRSFSPAPLSRARLAASVRAIENGFACIFGLNAGLLLLSHPPLLVARGCVSCRLAPAELATPWPS